MNKINIYTHPACLKHDTGPGHPECVARLEVLLELFDEMNLKTIPARKAAWEELTLVHPEDHLMAIQDAIPDHGHTDFVPETTISPGSWDAALYAAGAVCQAVDDVLSHTCARAFCAIRPPGHHAGVNTSEGFCILNNISIGALHALTKVKRVAIADFDVHHGNGTDEISRLHKGIFFASTHQWPLYSGSRAPEINIPEPDLAARIINRSLAAQTGSQEFRAAWEDILTHMDSFKPDLIMISAGFDAHRDDPLAQINLTEDDYKWVTEKLVGLANRHCGGKVISALEGGYDLVSLKASVATHLSALS